MADNTQQITRVGSFQTVVSHYDLSLSFIGTQVAGTNDAIIEAETSILIWGGGYSSMFHHKALYTWVLVTGILRQTLASSPTILINYNDQVLLFTPNGNGTNNIEYVYNLNIVSTAVHYWRFFMDIKVKDNT
jgi:hypothetical protein